jgi:hypothetical protein
LAQTWREWHERFDAEQRRPWARDLQEERDEKWMPLKIAAIMAIALLYPIANVVGTLATARPLGLLR